jgi:hypothetical protein
MNVTILSKRAAGIKPAITPSLMVVNAVELDTTHYTTDPLPSLNVAGSGANHWTYQNTKKLWQARFTELLEATDLPKFNESLLVEGLVCFPDKRKRDMGNFRYLAEKCLGMP